jgi:large subunit ribosomal protein L29
MVKADEIRELEDDLLAERIREFRREVFGLRFQHATGELENTSRLREVKHDLARALTVAHERGIDVQNAPRD